jgi:hypothetical protein
VVGNKGTLTTLRVREGASHMGQFNAGIRLDRIAIVSMKQ